MLNHPLPPIRRRDFLHVGVLAGLLGLSGCGEEGTVKKVDTPPSPTGNRARLQKLQKAADNPPASKK